MFPFPSAGYSSRLCLYVWDGVEGHKNFTVGLRRSLTDRGWFGPHTSRPSFNPSSHFTWLVTGPSTTPSVTLFVYLAGGDKVVWYGECRPFFLGNRTREERFGREVR